MARRDLTESQMRDLLSTSEVAASVVGPWTRGSHHRLQQLVGEVRELREREGWNRQNLGIEGEF